MATSGRETGRWVGEEQCSSSSCVGGTFMNVSSIIKNKYKINAWEQNNFIQYKNKGVSQA